MSPQKSYCLGATNKMQVAASLALVCTPVGPC